VCAHAKSDSDGASSGKWTRCWSAPLEVGGPGRAARHLCLDHRARHKLLQAQLLRAQLLRAQLWS